jgi:caffeoyl-CoA O-methyltransferase
VLHHEPPRQGGDVVTCEIDERSAAIARKFFAESPYGSRVDLRVTPALDLLQS